MTTADIIAILAMIFAIPPSLLGLFTLYRRYLARQPLFSRSAGRSNTKKRGPAVPESRRSAGGVSQGGTYTVTYQHSMVALATRHFGHFDHGPNFRDLESGISSQPWHELDSWSLVPDIHLDQRPPISSGALPAVQSSRFEPLRDSDDED